MMHLLGRSLVPGRFLSGSTFSGRLFKPFSKKQNDLLKAKSQDKSKQVEEDEQPISLTEANQYYDHRCEVIKSLVQKGGQSNPYPHKWHVDNSLSSIVREYSGQPIQDGQYLPIQLSTAGRVISIRKAGASLFFLDIESDGFHLQTIVNQQSIGDAEELKQIDDLIKRGDIVGVKGQPGRSKRGELSLLASQVQLLSPCLHMLPRERPGIKDPEVRFRQRYLDLLVNKNIRQKFLARHKMMAFLRRYLDEQGFIEVETPILALQSGGATAKPFKTFHNDMKMELTMRVAPELYLKNLIIGGFEKVYEIGKNFRNEGIDHNHNPEFTAIEFYWAYADYEDLMRFAEELVVKLVMAVCGSTQIQAKNRHTGQMVEIDFAGPWKRISIVPELEKILGVRFPNLSNSEARIFLDELCVNKGVHCAAPRTTARLLDKLVGHYIEPHCTQPTFLTDHPQIMSPLAKHHRSMPGLTERFELFINQYEIMNAYTELNDPFLQRKHFEDQMQVLLC